jgi:uncharacterized protein
LLFGTQQAEPDHGRMKMEFQAVKIQTSEGANVILGQSHFIKTVEDLYEILVSSVPGAKFGVAFCESSGPCLIRSVGNDEDLRNTAIRNAQAVAAGHFFVMILKQAYPINVLNAVKQCPEVCSIFCASANPIEVIVAVTEQGRGVMGVVDGLPPKGVEAESDVAARRQFLRTIGYKL